MSQAAGTLRHVLRRWPVLLIVVLGVAAYLSGVWRYLTLDTLTGQQAVLRALVAAHPFAAAGAFTAGLCVFLVLSLPGEGVLTVAGGFLFGLPLGTVLSVLGTSLAALALFLALRRSVSGLPAVSQEHRHGALVQRIRRRMAVDGVYVLLMLRVLPILPFAVVSLLPVLVGMRLRRYMAASVVGAVPPTLVFTDLGSGLDGMLAAHEPVSLDLLVSPRLLAPLAGLAVLSLLPLLWQRRGWTRD